MKPNPDVWKQLEQHAAAQLRSGFADQVLRKSQGPQASAWHQLQDHGAAQLRLGFADRVLRAVRARVEMPSLSGQVALSAATAAICMVAVVFLHDRSTRLEEARNLAGWAKLVADTQELSLTQ